MFYHFLSEDPAAFLTQASRGLVASLEAVAGRLGLPTALPSGVEARRGALRLHHFGGAILKNTIPCDVNPGLINP